MTDSFDFDDDDDLTPEEEAAFYAEGDLAFHVRKLADMTKDLASKITLSETLRREAILAEIPLTRKNGRTLERFSGWRVGVQWGAKFLWVDAETSEQPRLVIYPEDATKFSTAKLKESYKSWSQSLMPGGEVVDVPVYLSDKVMDRAGPLSLL